MTDATIDRLTALLGEQYRIVRELGGGGMSRVFLAEEPSLQRQVVIKLLAPELTSEAGIARFKQEAALTAQLQHPNIVPVLAFGARDGLLYYVTPFIAGETLRQRLEREGSLPVEEVLRLVREAAEALGVAHAQGVVHRDIKPENIFLSNGHAVLADFGIARSLHVGGGAPGTRLTAVGTSLGTPGYMSPEQAAGDDDVDARSDIYSLAVVAYEMLAGVPPFTGPTPRAVLAAHLSQTPEPVTSHRREVPAAVSTALDRALAKDPADRFASAAEFRDALSAAPATGARRRRPFAIAAAALVLVAAGAAWFVTRSRGDAVLDANLVAVAPFDVLDPSLAMWKEGMVDILSANLDGAGPLKTVPPTVVVRRWDGRADAPSAAALGERVHARYAIYGRFVRAGADSVRATATIYDVAAGRSLGDVQVRDASTRLDRLADSLTIGILQQLNQSRAIAAVRTASIGTSSLPAIKAFLRAEQFYRRSEWDSAVAYYRVAIREDSMFAPALRHLSNALGWNVGPGQGELARRYQYALLAGQQNHGLAPRESLLVAADSVFALLQVNTNHQGPTAFADARRLFATLEEGARRFPDDPEIWHKLGDVRYHYLSFVPGVTYEASREAFDRAIALDSAFAPSYLHMPTLALRGQDPEGAARYARAYLTLEPSGTSAEFMRALLRFLGPTPPSPTAVDSIVHALPVQALGDLYTAVESWMDPAESQVILVRAIRAYGRTSDAPPELSAFQADLALGYALAERGHVAEAAALVDPTMWRLTPQLALLGALPRDSANRLLTAQATHGGIRSATVTLRWWAERGDTVMLRRLAARVDTMHYRATLPAAYMPALRAAVHAHLDLARHDTAAALRDFTAVPDSMCVFDGCYDGVWYTKAQLLEAMHRDRDAMRVLEHEPLVSGPSRTLWHLERARVAERLGEREQARRDYAYVAAAWQHADSALQPAVAESRAALRRLQADAAR